MATPKAAPAARAPIRVTFKAPHKGLTPVTLLLKYPNTNRQIRVAMTDIFNASVELAMKKYGLSGMIPPRIYEMPIFRALLVALLGSVLWSPI